MNKVLVTSYLNPDLDGTACAIAYAELLKKKGVDVVVGVFGGPHREAQFVLQFLRMQTPPDANTLLNEYKEIILVDASDTVGISQEIKPEQVIEIVDHRKVTQVEKFPNAKAQIELVGSAATLIAEKFHSEDVAISRESSTLLYGAIVSNTVNFKANVTTERDKKMAEWLLPLCDLPDDFIHQMFVYKSQFTKSLKDTLVDDVADFTLGGKRIYFFQLEIVDVEELCKNKKEELITILDEVKKDKELDYVFVSCIDIEKGENTFIVADDETRELLENVLDVSFINNIAKREGIMMRKTISPLIKDYLEK